CIDRFAYCARRADRGARGGARRNAERCGAGGARARSVERTALPGLSEPIDDSAAPLARDLRLLVRERLTAGDSDQQVLNFLVARYGEFVLLKPRFELHNLLLWGLPPVALVAGMIALFVTARRRQSAN